MNREVKIGKFTLESLTTGMYEDAKIIFREYVQNSTDAIDDAIKAGLLKNREQGKIKIEINGSKKKISIKDNGIGVSSKEVWSILCDIGNSKKKHNENRGFRGIGRLGGLSYAKELYFITSFSGEEKKSIVKWDCEKLKELLQPDKYEDYDLEKVIKEVTIIDYEKEDKSAHFFKVELCHIDENYSDILDLNIIKDYLSQVAPVPFHATNFPFYNDTKEGFKNKLMEINKPLEEYYIYLNGDPNPIYKPYRTWFHTGQKVKSRSTDDIKGLKFIQSETKDGEILFWGWYALTNFYGQVDDDDIAGLRVRKDNILIGDKDTLNDFFTESRFNKRFIGEIYVYDELIIPNARRDYFEKNQSYWKFREELEKYTKGDLSRIPRYYSELNAATHNIKKSKDKINKIENKVKEGVASYGEKKQLLENKNKIIEDIKKNEKKIKNATRKINKLDTRIKVNTKKTLDESKKIKDNTNKVEEKIEKVEHVLTKTKVLSGYPRNVKKVLMEVFEVIGKEIDDDKLKNNLYKKIIEHLANNNK